MNDVAKVLVVDDDQMMRDFAARALRSLGYSSVTAADAAAALRVLEEDRLVGILIIDLRLKKGEAGAQLAREAFAIRPDIRVLLTSGDPVALQFAQRDMPQHVELLPKPFRRRDLEERLSRLQ